MCDENRGRLEARVWIKKVGGLALIGERFRGLEGRLTMVWYVDPESIVEVLWIEFSAGEDEVSTN